MLPPRLSSRRLAGTALAALCGLASGSGGAPPRSSSHGVFYARPDIDGDAAGTGRPPLKGSSPPLLARALQRQDKGNKNKEKDKGGEKAAPPPAPPAAAAGGDALHGTPATADCLRQFAAADEAIANAAAAEGGDAAPAEELVGPACLEWLRANPSFDLPDADNAGPPSDSSDAAYAYDVSRASELATAGDGTRTLTITYVLGPTDDAFAEPWRPSEPLGDRPRLKIDADGTGVPTKVSQLRFRLAETFGRARAEAALSGLAFEGGGGEAAPEAELAGATLRLWSITGTVFGGWVSEARGPAGWDEGSLTWDALVGGLEGGPGDLLPSGDEVLAEFGAVAAQEWNEADLTGRVSEMFAASGRGEEVGEDGGNSGWLSLRLSTDDADGVIYGSKDGRHDGPELVLRFVIREAGAETAGGGEEGGAETAEGSPVLPDNETQEAEIVQAEASPGEAQGVPATESAAEEAAEDPIQAGGAEVDPAQDPPPQSDSAGISQAEMEVSEEEPSPADEEESRWPWVLVSPDGAAEEEVVLPEDPDQAEEQAVEEETGWVLVSPDEAAGEEVVLPEDPDQTEEQADEEDTGWVSPKEAVAQENGWVSPAEMAGEPPDDATEDEADAGDGPGQFDGGQAAPPEDPGQADDEAEGDAPAPPAPAASVVSSSYRMAVTALRPSRGRGLRGAAARRLVQSGEEKEAPAIVSHLGSVYAAALTISPSRVSVVFEDDVSQEDLGGDDWEGLSGVVRRGDFRVVADFDDPDMASVTPDAAARVLDQATQYAFTGPEELEFVEIYKSTGEPIVDDPDGAEYDVTVLKVDYGLVGAAPSADAGPSEANMGDGYSSSAGREQDGGGSAEEAQSSWLQPALIAGASLLVVATTAVGTLLYKQRHRDLSPDGGHHDKESPRSLENTAPVSPSPKGDGGGLIGRIKKKSRFDYAEFEDSRSVEGMVEGGRDKSITAGADMGAFSPLTTDRAIMSATKGEDPAADAEAGQQPQPANILFSKYQNTSFDDSSVSDVSAQLLGAKSFAKNNGANISTDDNPNSSRCESYLFDNASETYNMSAMPGNLDGIVDGAGSPDAADRPSSPARDDDDNDSCSLSTGAVPSELYPSISFDSSMLGSNMSQIGLSTTGGHQQLLTSLDRIRFDEEDMPPPPSDAPSVSSSRQDSLTPGDFDAVMADSPVPTADQLLPSVDGVVNDASAAAQQQQWQADASRSIKNELDKVMQILASSPIKSGGEGDEEAPASASPSSVLARRGAGQYDGVNVLVPSAPVSPEPEQPSVQSVDHLKELNAELNDCIDILKKAKEHRIEDKRASGEEENRASAGNEVSSMVTEALD